MAQPARLTSDLLVRKGQALPASGYVQPAIRLAEVPAWPSKVQRPSPLAGVTLALAGGGSGRAERPVSLTLRLDPGRHSRLRIFAARRGQSAQKVLVSALDAYHAACGADCACMRGEAKDG